MPTVEEPARLLDLLAEAGGEAVSLDELEIVGVVDPARALELLELAGHAVQRVVETRPDRSITCVRLAAPEPPRPPLPPAPSRRPLLVALALALLVLVAVARR